MRWPSDRLQGEMGTTEIVFLVLAGVAPLGVVVSTTVLAIALGNGPGMPGTYVVAGAVLAVFAVGYMRMSRSVASAGGFYTLAQVGLGRRAAGATAYIAVLAYNASTVSILGALSFYAHGVMDSVAGVDLPWQAWAAVAVIVVAVLSWFEVTLTAKVLGLAVVLEVALLLTFDLGVLAETGLSGFSLQVFSPDLVLGPGFGVGLMLAFGSFVGFEAATLYGEESTNPRRSVPRATAIALALITVFFLVTAWATISAYGVTQAQGQALRDPGSFLFRADARYVGGFTVDAMQILVLTSLLAAFLAFHSNTARYQFSLARDGLLPDALARVHPTRRSPVAASAAQLALTASVVTTFALAGGNDPYLELGAPLFGVAVLGIVLLQVIVSAAAVAYFHRPGLAGVADIGPPVMAAAGLLAAFALMVAHYSTLTGSHDAWVNRLPWLLVLAAGLGVARTSLRSRPALRTRR